MNKAAVNEQELTPVEAAREAGIRLDAIYPVLRVGRIPARKVNGRWLIPAKALAEYIAKREERHGGK